LAGQKGVLAAEKWEKKAPGKSGRFRGRNQSVSGVSGFWTEHLGGDQSVKVTGQEARAPHAAGELAPGQNPGSGQLVEGPR